ncbi:uncharacterized protein LOC144109837 [Amblyomma americanum]
MPIQREAIENDDSTEDEGGDENYDDEDYSPCEEFEEKQGCVGNSRDEPEVYGECASGHFVYWCNQDVEKQQPMLNLQLCTAVLFSGCNPAATLKMLASIEQKSLLQELQGQQVNLAGDGRADSPGFSAKYGTYTLMDVERHKVLHFEIVQSNDDGGSCRMELEGLKQGLAFLQSDSIKVAVLVTDRHTQITCFLRNNKAAITHEFDVWHMLAPWIKSVCNHLYWAAASSEGKAELIVPKWLSLLNHVRDIHTHDQKLQDISNSKAFLQDMPRLSTRHQTYGLEAFHSLLVYFAPTTYHYSTQLAVLHYNENSGRGQACTKDGTLRWCVRYPKAFI